MSHNSQAHRPPADQRLANALPRWLASEGVTRAKRRIAAGELRDLLNDALHYGYEAGWIAGRLAERAAREYQPEPPETKPDCPAT